MTKVVRLEKKRISLRQVIFWTSILAGVVLILNYSIDVSTRRTETPACKWNLAEKPRDLSYVARYCYLNKDTVMLRLYDAKEEVLLAERMYFEMDYVMLNWIEGRLIYSNSEFDFIYLPPTLLDRLRAKLP